jgi:hypothetical protein
MMRYHKTGLGQWNVQAVARSHHVASPQVRCEWRETAKQTETRRKGAVRVG